MAKSAPKNKTTSTAGKVKPLSKQALALRARFKWWAFYDTTKAQRTKKVSKLVFGRGNHLSVSFSKPVSILDALLAADKKMNEPLTKAVWNKVRPDMLNKEQSFEQLTKKGGYWEKEKTVLLGHLLDGRVFPESFDEDVNEKGTFVMECGS